MQTHYFLGANTPKGFYSLYHGFPGEDDRLYIIKGSPGSGKSTFMKKLAAEMEREGVEAELIYCSGDPDSLDGVYFPELGIAYADGTAPHVLEPAYAGVRETYLNFAECLDTEGLWRERDRVYELNELYKGEYGRAYSAIAAAKAVTEGIGDGDAPGKAKEQTVKKASALARRLFGKIDGAPRVRERFIEAFTCKGWVRRYDTVTALAEEVYLAESYLGLDRLFAETVAKKAVENNRDVIICRDPMCPDRVSHVIVPQASAAIVSGSGTGLPRWKAKTVQLDPAPGKSASGVMGEYAEKRRKMRDALLAEAQAHLAGAKAYHDRLEAVYREHADFRAADRLFEEHLERLRSMAGK